MKKLKRKNGFLNIRTTPHYFKILDGDKVIFSTDDKPLFLQESITKKEVINIAEIGGEILKIFPKTLRRKAKRYLDKKFPGWEDTTKHF